MWGRYQIHVLVSDFFRSAPDPVSLTELPCEGAPVLDRIWRKAAAAAHRVSWLTCGWGNRKKKHDLFFHSVDKTQRSLCVERIWPIAQFCQNLAMRLSVERRAASLSELPSVVRVPVAVYSLQMTTFIHQSQLRSTPGIPRSTSFQCYLSLLRPPSFAILPPPPPKKKKELSFYCKYSSWLSVALRVRVALRQGRF